MKLAFRFSLPHALVALLLLCIELFIAFQVRQPFIRFHLGDLLVACLLHFSIRTAANWPVARVAMGVLVFAVLVECTQAAGFIHHLGLADAAWARFLLGDTFQWLDLLMYAAGAALAALFDRRISGKLPPMP